MVPMNETGGLNIIWQTYIILEITLILPMPHASLSLCAMRTKSGLMLSFIFLNI